MSLDERDRGRPCDRTKTLDRRISRSGIAGGHRIRTASLIVMAGATLMTVLLDRFVVGEAPLLAHAAADCAAHALTTCTWALALLCLGCPVSVVPALAGGVLIDLDHGLDLLGLVDPPGGTSRQVTHSLLPIAVLIGITALARGQRRGWLSAAMGVSSHLLRDASRGAVLLWWPLSYQPVALPSWVIDGTTVGLALFAALVSLMRPAGDCPVPGSTYVSRSGAIEHGTPTRHVM